MGRVFTVSFQSAGNNELCLCVSAAIRGCSPSCRGGNSCGCRRFAGMGRISEAVSTGKSPVLAAFSLALIAVAYLAHQIARRPAPMELLKAVMLAVAFLFWAANQFWPDSPQATLFNDIAIALFVLDVFLVIAGWPRAAEDSSFAESRSAGCAECCAASCREERCCAGPISAA